MRIGALRLAAALAMTPLGVQAADLVVWWEKGYYAAEDEAIRETIAAFEQGSGKQVELVIYPEAELPSKIVAALAADAPPDLAFGLEIANFISEWAFEDRLVDLSDAVGTFANIFDPNALNGMTLLNGGTGQRALYALPVGISTNHIHVWKSLLEQAGFTPADIPKEWDAFWSFWCDRVQPAIRQATDREDLWGVGLPMSVENTDTVFQFLQFVAAYKADYVTPDGRLVIDDPEIRRKLIDAIDSFTEIYRKDCSPPDSATWPPYGNNERFLKQVVVMTTNETLSIPNELKRDRPEDYRDNVSTIEWPLGPGGEIFPIVGTIYAAVVFKDGSHVSAATDFVRFLVSEGWLAHYLDFSAERLMPPLPALLDAPFWLDPSDRHRMAAAMQVAARPLAHDYAAASGNWRHDLVAQQNVWANAIHRVAAENISPEQAVDEAIARIKQIVAE
jgi:multiple sugar transport system substrate-binding protein